MALLLLGGAMLVACGDGASAPGAPETSPAPVVIGATPGQGVALPLTSARPTVIAGGMAFEVELALTPAQRTQGLSDRAELPRGTGMLFVFDQEARYAFWMKGMLFPLDLVWISAQCEVVEVTPNAPAPPPALPVAELPLYIPAAPVRYVLEINAGEAEPAGIRPGVPVKYAGSLAGLYGC